MMEMADTMHKRPKPKDVIGFQQASPGVARTVVTTAGLHPDSPKLSSSRSVFDPALEAELDKRQGSLDDSVLVISGSATPSEVLKRLNELQAQANVGGL